MSRRMHRRSRSARLVKQQTLRKACESVLPPGAIEPLEQRRLLSTVVFTDNYSADTTANYTQSDQTAAPDFVDSWTVDSGTGTLNYAVSTTTTGNWNTSVFLTKPSFASTAGLAVSQTSGDLIAPVNFQAGLVLSGDTTNGGFVVAEYDAGQYANHLVLLRETGGQLVNDEGGTANPPVLADFGDISAFNTDTFHVVGKIDRTGTNPILTVSITDLTNAANTFTTQTVVDAADPANYGGTAIGWRARYDDMTAAFGVDNLELDDAFEGATSAPAAPTNLTATQVPNSLTVNLAWTNNATNATSVTVERSADGTNFTTLASLDPTATTYTDTLPTTGAPGSTYVYRVRAFNGFNGGTFAASNVAGPVTIPTTIGAEAHYYNVAFWAGTPAVSTQVLTVNYNSGNGSPDPAIRNSNNSTAFTGKVHTNAAGTYTFISNTDDDGYLWVNGQLVSSDATDSLNGGHGTRNATNLIPISLAADTDYDFVLLEAQGGGGAGANMLWVEPDQTTAVLVPAANLKPVSDTPAAPTNLAVDPFSASLSPNPNAHGVAFTFDTTNVAVVKYQLQRSSDAGATWTTVNSTDPQGSVQDFNVSGPNIPFLGHIEDDSTLPGTSYQYRLLATNFDGTSAPSNMVPVTTPALPDQSPGVQARFFNGELAAASVGDDARNLLVNGTPAEFIADQFGIPGGGSTSPIDFNFNNGSPDPNPYPDVYRIHPDDFATLFTGKIHTDAAGTYTFVTNSDDDGYMWVNGVLVSSDPGGHGQENAPNITPISLAANSEYDFVVIQQEMGGGAGIHVSWIEPDGMGGSTALAIIPDYTPADVGGPLGGFEMNMDLPDKQSIDSTTGAVVTDTTQSAAGNVVLSQSSDAGNKLTWIDQSTSELWFQVERSTNGTTFSVIGNAGFNATSFTDTTAVAGTHYFYRVRGMNFDGQGVASNVADTAQGVTLPVPTLIAGGSLPNNAILLTFADGSANAGGFQIQYHDSTSSTFVDLPGAASLPASATSFLVQNLDPTQTYTFQIRALPGTGALNPSDFSAPVTAQPGTPATIDKSGGFDTSESDLIINGNSASVTTIGSNTVLQITPAANSKVASIYYNQQDDVAAFDTTFDFAFDLTAPGNPVADGFTFVLQNGAPTAIGGGGGNLGYQGIGLQSVAVKFDLYNNVVTTGLYTNGNAPNDNTTTTPGAINNGYDMTGSGINWHTNFADKFRAHLNYDGTTLSETVTDLTTNATFTMSWAVNIPQILGNTSGYVGFTGATGGANAEQDILNWKYTPLLPGQAQSQTNNTVAGTSGIDTITIKKDGSNPNLVDITVGATTQQADITKPIVINGGGGTDTLIIDSSAGQPIPSGTGGLVLNQLTGGTFTLGGSLPTLDATHTVDITNSTVNIPYTGASPLSTIQAAIKGGALFSSTAAGTSGKFAIADVDDGSQVTLSYRVVGDINADGTVGFSDLLTLAQNYNGTGRDWSKGDLTYDGTVGFADLLALAQHYNQTAAAAPAAAAATPLAARASDDLLPKKKSRN